MSEVTQKIKVFKWKGINKRGRKIKGEIVSPNRIDATLELEGRKINVTSITEKSFNGINPFSRVLKQKDITIFTRQLGMLLVSGMELVKALDISADSLFNPKLKSIVIKLKNDVVSGSAFSEALSKYPKYFNQVYINMVMSGEDNAVLGETLLAIAQHREKNEKLGTEFKRAMVYPSIVLLFAALVVLFMLVKIIPEFEEVYATYNESLPEYTEFVLGIAKYLQENILIVSFFAFLTLLVVYFLKKTSYRFNLFLSKTALRMPVLKHVFKRMAMVRFFQTTLITHKSGLSLEKSVGASAESMSNLYYKEIFKEIKEDVISGESLNSAMKSSGVIPEMAIQFIENGEESGDLIDSLERGAKLYEEEMDDYFIMAAKSLEPLIMVAVSFLVGAIIIAMYLPIFYFGSIIN